MNAPLVLSGARPGTGLSAPAALALLAACASSGPQPTASPPAPGATAAAETVHPDAGRAEPRGGSHFVLTAAEIEKAPGVMNAYEAVQTLRPHFLRVRGPTSLGTARSGSQAGGRRRRDRGQGQEGGGAQSAPEGPRRAELPSAAGRFSDDQGIVVYLDRQRLGRVSTLEDIPAGIIAEIRLLNVAEANTRFGRGHPHGVILVTMKSGILPPE